MSEDSRENANRRDDIVERDIMRGSDRDDDIWQTRERERAEDRARRLERSDILFSNYVNNVNSADVKRDDRDGLRFRDASIHSTAVGALEGEISAVGAAMQEEVDENEEN